MLLLYIIKQPPFSKVQKSRRVVSYKKHMTKREYALVRTSELSNYTRYLLKIPPLIFLTQ